MKELNTAPYLMKELNVTFCATAIYTVPSRFLGHTIAHSLSVQRKLSNKNLTNRFIDMLGKVNKAPQRGEYKLQIYKRFVVPSFHFLLAVDLITKSTVSKLQGCAMKCIKSWLGLCRSTSIAVIHHPDVLGVSYLPDFHSSKTYHP